MAGRLIQNVSDWRERASGLRPKFRRSTATGVRTSKYNREKNIGDVTRESASPIRSHARSTGPSRVGTIRPARNAIAASVANRVAVRRRPRQKPIAASSANPPANVQANLRPACGVRRVPSVGDDGDRAISRAPTASATARASSFALSWQGKRAAWRENLCRCA